MVEHAVWTFRVHGGHPVRVAIPHNPHLVHEGATTLWKLVGSQSLADSVRTALEEAGCVVQVTTEVQTPELIEGRGRLDD